MLTRSSFWSFFKSRKFWSLSGFNPVPLSIYSWETFSSLPSILPLRSKHLRTLSWSRPTMLSVRMKLILVCSPICISYTPNILISKVSGYFLIYLKYSKRKPLLKMISCSESFKVLSIKWLLSGKKKKDGDLPPPVWKLYIPDMFRLGTKELSNCSSVKWSFLIFLKILGANSLMCIFSSVASS